MQEVKAHSTIVNGKGPLGNTGFLVESTGKTYAGTEGTLHNSQKYEGPLGRTGRLSTMLTAEKRFSQFPFSHIN